MRLKVIALVAFAAFACLGCEENSITACGFACKNAGARMVSWSKDKGCVCSTEASQ